MWDAERTQVERTRIERGVLSILTRYETTASMNAVLLRNATTDEERRDAEARQESLEAIARTLREAYDLMLSSTED
jgi:hypothetical protein